MKHESLESVSRKVVEETTVLHQQYKKEKEEGVKIRNDANKVSPQQQQKNDYHVLCVVCLFLGKI